MKICFTMKPQNTAFGGGNQFALNLTEFLERKGHEVVFTLEDNLDAIFIMDPRILKYNKIDMKQVLKYKLQNKNVKLIHRINDCDAPRDGKLVIDEFILNYLQVVDKPVFVSKWTKNYFKNKGDSNRNGVAINSGCNHNYFYPSKNKFFDKKNVKIVTHHWSNNWNKGFEYYKLLDEYLEKHPELSFTFIGRNFPPEYQPKNIKVIGPFHGIELGNELRKHDIYVTASKFENCPMHVIEGLSCGLPMLYHKNLGGGVEICIRNGGEVFQNFDELVKKLNLIIDNYEEYTKKIAYKKLDSEYCNKRYYDEIIGLFE